MLPANQSGLVADAVSQRAARVGKGGGAHPAPAAFVFVGLIVPAVAVEQFAPDFINAPPKLRLSVS